MIWLLVDSRTVGGIERHVATLAEALSNRGLPAEILLYADYAENAWRRQLDDARLPYRVLDGTLAGLWRAVAAARPRLLHSHGYKANILGRLIGKLTGTPVVATFHAGERGPFPVGLYQLVDEWSSCLGGRLAVSEAIRAKLPYSSTLVGNFLLASDTPPTGDLPRRIGFVGRLSHEKAPDRFCELARRCRARGDVRTEWHVWGDGPMRQELERACSSDVVFHGLVTDLAPVWATIGLLVMPSRAEGLPMAALEALASGVPVAASTVGALPQVVIAGKTGWLFDGDHLDDMEAAIDRWSRLDGQSQQEMRLSCWRFVRETYSDRQHVPTILETYASAGFNPIAEPLRAG